MPTGTEHAARVARSIRARPPWLLWLLAAVPVALLYPSSATHIPFDGLYLAVGVGAVAACVVGIRRNQPRAARAWWVAAWGVAVTVLGDLVYAGHMLVTGEEPPFPGLPDPLYLVGLTSLAVAGVMLAWQRHRTATTRSLIDASLVAVSAAAVLWLAVGADTLRGEEATAGVIGVGLAYPLLDAALFGVLAALLFGRQRASVAIRLLGTAFTIQLIADTVYLTEAVEGLYAAGGLLDVAWLLTYVLIAAAMLHPSMADGSTPIPPRLVELSLRHLVGLTLPVVLAATALLYVAHANAADDPDRFLIDLSVLVPLGVIISVLLVWRVANVSNELTRTARERDAGLHRELIVTDVASQLARANTVPEIRQVLGRAGRLLPDPEGRVELSSDPDGAAHEVAWVHPVADDDAALIAISAEPLLEDHERALERIASDVAMALDRCRLADELRSSERRFRSLVRHAPDAITVHDADGTLTYVSPALGQIVGVPEATLQGRRWDELVHPHDLDAVRSAHEALADRPTSTCVLELRLRHHDGSWRWVETRLTNLVHDPSVQGVVANHRDITERQRLQRELQHQATHDPLTGVANRRRFADEVSQLEPAGTDAIVFLDLDHFKEINDRLGHATGDLVLGEVARRLVAGVRTDDLVARLGGDEFAVLLRGTTSEAAQRTADRLLDAVTRPLPIGGEQLRVGASVGLAVAGEGRAGDDLLHDADLAMYQAKAAGRGRVEHATPQVRESTTRRLALEADLRSALEAGDLTLQHRPVVDLLTGHTVGSQTELRWPHPTRGDVPPSEFLVAAERIGVQDALATWSFQEACWSIRSWLDTVPDAHIVVTIPGIALRTPGLTDRLEAALRSSSLPGEHLVLQVEGGYLLDRTPAADHNLSALRDAGIRIRATNLATATPMRVVRDAPVDELLMASDLVAGLTQGPEEAALGRAVLLLADSFGIEVVAEGIATAAQHAALVERGAVRGTGPLFGDPVPADDLARALLAERPTLGATPG